MKRSMLFTMIECLLCSSSVSASAPEFIIDSHYHSRATKEWVDLTVEVYRKHNAMCCALTWIKDIDTVKEAVKKYPDVFIGFGRVELDNPNAVREVQQFHEAGFVGMKFHSPRHNYDDPIYFQTYRLCEEYGMHMLFHTGISSRRIKDEPSCGSSSRMRPMYLDTICRQFPKATIQGAHFGNPWYEEAAEAARWNPNLYFDVTGSTLHKFIKLDRLGEFKDILWWASDEGEATSHTLKGGPSAFEHIVFGTDEGPSGLETNIERFQRLLDANKVPDKLREKMWGLTMADVLGIDPLTHKFKKSESSMPTEKDKGPRVLK